MRTSLVRQQHSDALVGEVEERRVRAESALGFYNDTDGDDVDVYALTKSTSTGSGKHRTVRKSSISSNRLRRHVTFFEDHPHPQSIDVDLPPFFLMYRGMSRAKRTNEHSTHFLLKAPICASDSAYSPLTFVAVPIRMIHCCPFSLVLVGLTCLMLSGHRSKQIVWISPE